MNVLPIRFLAFFHDLISTRAQIYRYMNNCVALDIQKIWVTMPLSAPVACLLLLAGLFA